MSAIVTDQFRILNASNFVDSIDSANNSYYVTVGLPNPAIVGYGRSTTWNTNPPTPLDNLASNSHAGDVVLYGKYSGSEISTKEGDEYLIMKEEDVLAVVGK